MRKKLEFLQRSLPLKQSEERGSVDKQCCVILANTAVYEYTFLNIMLSRK